MPLKVGDPVTADCQPVDHLLAPRLLALDGNGVIAEVPGLTQTARGKLPLSGRKAAYVSEFAQGGLTICDDDPHGPFAQDAGLLRLSLKAGGKFQLYVCTRDWADTPTTSSVWTKYWPNVLQRLVNFGVSAARPDVVVEGYAHGVNDNHATQGDLLIRQMILPYVKLRPESKIHLICCGTTPLNAVAKTYSQDGSSVPLSAPNTSHDPLQWYWLSGSPANTMLARPEKTGLVIVPPVFDTYPGPFSPTNDQFIWEEVWRDTTYAAGTGSPPFLALLDQLQAGMAFADFSQVYYSPNETSDTGDREGLWQILTNPTAPLGFDFGDILGVGGIVSVLPLKKTGTYALTDDGNTILGSTSPDYTDDSETDIPILDAAKLAAHGLHVLVKQGSRVVDIGGTLTAAYFSYMHSYYGT